MDASRLIGAALPDLRVESIVREGEGDFYIGYTVNGEWLVRVAKGLEASRSLDVEAHIMPLLAPTLPLPVPVIEMRGRLPEDTGGWAVAAHRKIEGSPLEPGEHAALTTSEQEAFVVEMGAFLHALHSFDPLVAMEAGVEASEYPFARTEEGILQGSTANICAATLRTLREHAATLGPDRLAAYERAAMRLLSGKGAGRPVLVHGDLSGGHVLFQRLDRPAHVAGVIDFSDLLITEPGLDFMYLYESYGESFLRALLRHYGYTPPEAEAAIERVQTLATWHDALRVQWRLEHGYPPVVSP